MIPQSLNSTSLTPRVASLFLLVGLCAAFGPFSCDIGEDETVFIERGTWAVDVLGGIAALPNGSVYWISAADEISQLDLDGTITAHTFTPTSVGLAPTKLLVGSDGNLWTWSLDDNEIIEMTPAGTFSQHAITTPASGVQDMVLGPDGNMWFVQTAVEQIAKITPAGAVTEYATATGEVPFTITSDGTVLWLATSDGSLDGRIESYDTDGVQLTSEMFASSYFPGYFSTALPDGSILIGGVLNATPGVRRVNGAGTVLNSGLPVTGGTNSLFDFLPVSNGVLIVGGLALSNGSSVRVARLSLGMDLLSQGSIGNVPRYAALNPVNGWVYAADSGSSPTSIIAFEEVLAPHIRESEKIRRKRRE